MYAGGWYVLVEGDPRRAWDSRLSQVREDRAMNYEDGFTNSSLVEARRSAATLRLAGKSVEVVSRKELFKRLGVEDMRDTRKWMKGG